MHKPEEPQGLDFNHRFKGRRISMLIDAAVRAEREKDRKSVV